MMRRLWIPDQRLLGLVIAVSVGMLLTAGATVAFVRTEIDRRASTARIQRQIGAANIGNCIRANINAAVVRISVTRPEPGRTAAQDAADNRIADNLYPVLDCLQSQRQSRSVKLSPEQSSRYVQLVTAGRAPIVAGGRVVGSRPAVLESIDLPDEISEPPSEP